MPASEKFSNSMYTLFNSFSQVQWKWNTMISFKTELMTMTFSCPFDSHIWSQSEKEPNCQELTRTCKLQIGQIVPSWHGQNINPFQVTDLCTSYIFVIQTFSDRNSPMKSLWWESEAKVWWKTSDEHISIKNLSFQCFISNYGQFEFPYFGMLYIHWA